MSFSAGTVSVNATATAIVQPNNPVIIKNNGPEPVFLGGASTVTADTSTTGGLVLGVGQTLFLPQGWTGTGWYAGNSLYGITASGSADVTWFVTI